jgi:hypothetical protein
MDDEEEGKERNPMDTKRKIARVPEKIKTRAKSRKSKEKKRIKGRMLPVHLINIVGQYIRSALSVMMTPTVNPAVVLSGSRFTVGGRVDSGRALVVEGIVVGGRGDDGGGVSIGDTR